MAENWKIVLFATLGLSSFVRSALLSIKQCGIDLHRVQVVFPANAERELDVVAKSFGAHPRILEQLVEVESSDIPVSYLEWDTPAFNRLMKYRFPALRAILAEGGQVIYCDVDVIWLRNPLPYLSSVLDRYTWACQTETFDEFPPHFCLGFFALSGRNQTLEIIDHHISRYQGDDQKSDQMVFRDILLENPLYLAQIFPLPEGLFPIGLLYRSLDKRAEPPVPMQATLEPFIFHANWCVGLENKRRLLAHVRTVVRPDEAARQSAELEYHPVYPQRSKGEKSAQIAALNQQLRTSEADRAERLNQINRLTDQLRVTYQDRSARLNDVNTLTDQLRISEADRATRLEHIKTLTDQLRISEADRAARLDQINTLTALVRESEADAAAKARAIMVQTQQIFDQEQQIERIRRSMLWRVTGPLRSLKALLSAWRR